MGVLFCKEPKFIAVQECNKLELFIVRNTQILKPIIAFRPCTRRSDHHPSIENTDIQTKNVREQNYKYLPLLSRCNSKRLGNASVVTKSHVPKATARISACTRPELLEQLYQELVTATMRVCSTERAVKPNR